jgi:hypothetical protein
VLLVEDPEQVLYVEELCHHHHHLLHAVECPGPTRSLVPLPKLVSQTPLMIGDPVIPNICLRQYETLTPLIAQEKRNIYTEKSVPNQAPNSQINNVNLMVRVYCYQIVILESQNHLSSYTHWAKFCYYY